MRSVRAVVRLAVLVLVLAQIVPAVALADEPSPKPAPTPKPTPAPAPAAPTFTAEEYALAQAIAQATSLGVRIEAERKLAASERAFIDGRTAQLRAEREALLTRIAALSAEAETRQREVDRILRREYLQSRRTPFEVLLSTGSIVSAVVATSELGSLADAERQAIAAVQLVQADLTTRRAELAAHEAELAAMADSLAVRDGLLAKLAAAADRLAKGGTAAEITVLREIVDAELAAGAKVDQLIAAAAAAAGAPALPASAWVRPAKGVVSQGFGPSPLALEPPRTYHGVTYPNFHDGIDIAAPLGTPVLAAAAGRIAFVGHLPDGAEVVLIAHDSGLFTLYAHLDDTHLPPTVKVGDAVKAGDPLGVIGLTGITTGPHLHFVIRRGDEPLDPSGLLPAS